MIDIQSKCFKDCLDTVQLIYKPAGETLGEDSFYCSNSSQSAIVSVLDGCGGLGARKYDSYQGHTGAYIASRVVSGAIHDWYHDNSKYSWEKAAKLTKSIDDYIRQAYKICDSYGIENMRILGSMVRKFPTTLALAYAEKEDDHIMIHILWAGDSRVYLLDDKGLAQLTLDDTDVEDALENLFCDAAMTNVLSSDGDYRINYKTIRLKKPGLIFAATDGCFGYIPSPMEFEYTLLKTLADNKSPRSFKKALCNTLGEYAGDDLTMGIMSFCFESYENTCKWLEKRLTTLTETYINPINKGQNEDLIKALWDKYKPGYERFLK